jgi:hypothetical protein
METSKPQRAKRPAANASAATPTCHEVNAEFVIGPSENLVLGNLQIQHLHPLQLR